MKATIDTYKNEIKEALKATKFSSKIEIFMEIKANQILTNFFAGMTVEACISKISLSTFYFNKN